MHKHSFIRMMKKLTGLLLICSLFLHCLCRIGVFTYFLINQDYIAEELCLYRNEPVNECEGSCYLNSMLDQVDGGEEKQPVRYVQVQEILLFFSVETLPVPSFTAIPDLLSMWYLPDTEGLYIFYLNSIFQPPRI